MRVFGIFKYFILMIHLFTSLLLGFLMILDPCTLFTSIAAIGYIDKDINNRRKVLHNGLMFVLGKLSTYVLLAIPFIIGAETSGIKHWLDHWGEPLLAAFMITCGILLLFTGRHHHDHDHEHDHAYMHEHGIAHSHGHVHENQRAVVNRLARAIGHLEKVKRMVEEGYDCSEVLVQLAAVRSAIDNTGKVILQDHMRHCMVDAVSAGDMEAIDDLCQAVDKFMK